MLNIKYISNISIVISASLLSVNLSAYASDLNQRNEQDNKDPNLISPPTDIRIDRPPELNNAPPDDIIIDRPQWIKVEPPDDIIMDRP